MATWPAKLCGRKFRVRADAKLAAAHLKQTGDLLGKDPITLGSLSPVAVIQLLAAADGANSLEHLLSSLREVLFEPVLESGATTR